MGVYQVCSNKSPVVKIGPASGVIDFIFMYIVKTLKNKPRELELRYQA
jgi:hypothetical protein